MMQMDQECPLFCLDANEAQAARYDQFVVALAACVAEMIIKDKKRKIGEEDSPLSPLRTDSICWDCTNATVAKCPWIRQQEYIWDDAVTEVTVNGLRYKVVRCANYVPDAVSDEVRVAHRPLVACI